MIVKNLLRPSVASRLRYVEGLATIHIGANCRRPAAPTSVRPSSAPKKRTWSVRDGGDIMDAEISVFFLFQLASAAPPPAIIDVRHAAAFERDPRVIPGAIRRLPDLEAWQAILEPWRTTVVYCEHGGD